MAVRPLRPDEEEVSQQPKGRRVRKLGANEEVVDEGGLSDALMAGANLAGGAIAQGSRALSDATTGIDRGRGTLPEFGSLNEIPTGTQAKLGLGFFTTPDPVARMQMIAEAIPGAKFSKDENDNTVIQLPEEMGGKKAFMNAPGLSLQDFSDVVGDIVKFLPATALAGMGRNVLSRFVLGAAGSGATAGAEDVAANLQGADTGVRGERAGTTGLLGGAAELANPLLRNVQSVFRQTFGRRTREIFDDGGNLTPQARAALRRANIDPDDVTPEVAKSAIQKSEAGAKGNVQGVAQAEEFGVPFTRGQATENFGQLAEEEAFRKRGDMAGDIMRSFDERQQTALREGVENLNAGFSGRGAPIETRAQGGAQLGERVAQKADEAWDNVNLAFAEVRGENASLTRDGLDRLGKALNVIEREAIPVQVRSMEATRAGVRAIRDLTKRPPSTLQAAQATPSPFRDVPFDRISSTRRTLVGLQKAANNNADRRGIKLLRDEFDEYLEDAVDNALFAGDKEFLDQFRNANALRRQYGDMFETRPGRSRSGRKVQDPGGLAVEKIAEREATDEQVMNLVFGTSKVIGPDVPVKTIRALRRAAGDDEVVNSTLKQMAWRNIADQAFTKAGKFNPRSFAQAYNNQMKDSPTVMREIFTDDELKKVERFRNVALQTLTPDGALNPSGTAGALVRMAGSIGQMLGLQKGGIGFGALGGRLGRGGGGAIERQLAKQEALDAVSPQNLLPSRANNAVIAGAIGATRQTTDEE